MSTLVLPLASLTHPCFSTELGGPGRMASADWSSSLCGSHLSVWGGSKGREEKGLGRKLRLSGHRLLNPTLYLLRVASRCPQGARGDAGIIRSPRVR